MRDHEGQFIMTKIKFTSKVKQFMGVFPAYVDTHTHIQHTLYIQPIYTVQHTHTCTYMKDFPELQGETIHQKLNT